MALRANIVANFAGQAWRALMAFAFVPVYIKYLGVEAYGLIGVYALLQAWLGFLDMGLRPSLSREMSRFMGGDNDAANVRDLLRSIEIIGLGTTVLVTAGVWVASDWLAESWLSARSLPTHVVAQALRIMGAVSALAFLESIYISSIIGLQRQVAMNIMSSAIVTVRYVGVIAVLAWCSATIEAYFLWQVAVSALSVAVSALFVYRVLPAIERRARFSAEALRTIWKFASGMVGITLLALVLTQVDKMLLSKLLPLERFAHYILAGSVAGVLGMLAAPVAIAFYPRMTQLVESGDQNALERTYRSGVQLITVLLGPAALMLILFSEHVLLLWTANPILVAEVAPILKLLACGTLLNSLMWMPYHLQLAHGWTSLSIRINIVAVLIIVPAISIAVPAYGAIAAGWAWLALNTGYVMFGVTLMHRQLLKSAKWHCYWEGVVLPLCAAVCVGGVCSLLFPEGQGHPLAEFVTLGAIYLAMSLSAVLAAALSGAGYFRQIRGALFMRTI